MVNPADEKMKGAQFVMFMGPLLDALRALGGSATPIEAINRIAEDLNIPEQKQNELTKSGTPRFANQVAWARQYLAWEGLLDSSRRGIWSLTDKGQKTFLSPEKARDIFLKWVKIFADQRKETKKEIIEKATEEVPPVSNEEFYPGDYRTNLIKLLKQLPPAGFERLCQRLLRESGFSQVSVTGRSGDGGIDGNGVLRLNPFVSVQVLFQCKRYDRTVSPSEVRDFRGAMMGRADKGIILTTGTFSTEARKEAFRDGAPPIELVDGQRLVEMFESLELGLKPKTVYEIDSTFFDDFRG
jgi:restriction system protein